MKRRLYLLYVILWTVACGAGIVYYSSKHNTATVIIFAVILVGNFIYLAVRRRRVRRVSK